MPRAKENNQLKLGLDWTFMAEIKRKEEAPEVFEASSKAFRKRMTTKSELPLWKALIANHDSSLR